MPNHADLSRRRHHFLIPLAILLAIPAALPAADHPTISGKVVAITEGDMLTVLDSGKVEHKIRLASIDAPEEGQAFGTKAKEALSEKVFDRYVSVALEGVDRYGREIGRITCGKSDINMQMVREGFAWRYVRYDKRGEFTEAENEARRLKLGLWADPHPIPPWEFRQQKRNSPTPSKSPGR
jgi:endonuclease YncB( thermonuclease family)